LCWDDSVYYQSRHLPEYGHYLDKLAQEGLTYRCVCSRKALAGQSGNKSGVYRGTCRNKSIKESSPHAIRIKIDENELAFSDGLQGEIKRQIIQDDGDFILKRRDNIIAYQFAVVIDDYLQQVNHVVRGCDLLLETPKQIYLQHKLSFLTPRYKHVPVIVDEKGHKLSKQTLATAVDIRYPNKTLFDLLVMLKQKPPDDLKAESVNELLDWSVLNWSSEVMYLTSRIIV
jgi:glutamyl-Q tRNA(Asp) synthetase